MTTTTAQDKYNEAFKEYSECNDYAQSFEADRESFAARQAEINKLAAELATLRSTLAADKAMNREDAKEAKDLRKAAEKAMKAAKREADREAKRKAKASKKTEGKAKAEQPKGKTNQEQPKAAFDKTKLAAAVISDLMTNYGMTKDMTRKQYDAIMRRYYVNNHPDKFSSQGQDAIDLQTAKCGEMTNAINTFWKFSKHNVGDYRKAA